MASLMINVTSGPDNPTKAALGFLVARTAAEEGHDVTLFLAGDGVAFLREPMRENANGIGTGNIKEHAEAFLAGGGKVYASKMSCMARGIGEDALGSLNGQFGLPKDLVRLTLEHDQVVTY